MGSCHWTTKDGAGLGGGLNLYVYAVDDPNNFKDSSGQRPDGDPLPWGDSNFRTGALWGAALLSHCAERGYCPSDGRESLLLGARARLVTTSMDVAMRSRLLGHRSVFPVPRSVEHDGHRGGARWASWTSICRGECAISASTRIGVARVNDRPRAAACVWSEP